MRLLKSIGFIATMALLVAVIWRSDPQRIAAHLSSASLAHVIAGLILVQVQIVLSALRWRFTAARLGQSLDRGRAIGEYYLGTLLNQLLPGGVAGDTLRAFRNRAGIQGGWKVPAQAVILERVAGQGIFFLIAIFGVLIWPLLDGGMIPENLRAPFQGFALFVAAGVSAVLIVFRYPPRKIQPCMKRLQTAFAQVFLQDRAWLLQAVFSITIVGSYIGMFMVASAAVGAPLPALAAVTVIPLGLLTMLIPATIAGWGARETAAASLWPLFGYTASDGIAASILYGLMALVGAAPGVIVVVATAIGQKRT
jgi:uncharacterized membrane protein YbhN (UPF0104 family)